jgi:hypothetical protein
MVLSDQRQADLHEAMQRTWIVVFPRTLLLGWDGMVCARPRFSCCCSMREGRRGSLSDPPWTLIPRRQRSRCAKESITAFWALRRRNLRRHIYANEGVLQDIGL